MENKKRDKYLYMTNPNGLDEAFRIWDWIEYNGKEFIFCIRLLKEGL